MRNDHSTLANQDSSGLEPNRGRENGSGRRPLKATKARIRSTLNLDAPALEPPAKYPSATTYLRQHQLQE